METKFASILWKKTELPVISKRLIRLSPHDKVVESTLFMKEVTGVGYGTVKNVLVVDNQKKDCSFLANQPNGTVFIFQSLDTHKHEPIGNCTLHLSPSSVEFYVGEDTAIHAHRIQSQYSFDPKLNQVTESIQIIIQNKHQREVEVVVEEILFRWPVAKVSSAEQNLHVGHTVTFTVKIKAEQSHSFYYTATYTLNL